MAELSDVLFASTAAELAVFPAVQLAPAMRPSSSADLLMLSALFVSAAAFSALTSGITSRPSAHGLAYLAAAASFLTWCLSSSWDGGSAESYLSPVAAHVILGAFLGMSRRYNAEHLLIGMNDLMASYTSNRSQKTWLCSSEKSGEILKKAQVVLLSRVTLASCVGGLDLWLMLSSMEASGECPR